MDDPYLTVQAGGVRFAYIERGSGAPVVLVHGSGPTDMRTWGAQIEPFSERFRVIAYSQRNHFPNAWTGWEGVNSTYDSAGDLAGLIDSLRLDRVHLVGSSYGAEVILRFAVEHPQRVRALVVAEPALFTWLVALPGGETMFNEYAATVAPAREAVRNGNLDEGARLFIDAALGDGIFDILPAATKNRIKDNAHLIQAEFSDIREVTTDITHGEAASIQAPTLLLTGSDSPKMFGLVSAELARYLPNVEQQSIEGASHILHSMNPSAFNAAVLEFLARHSG